MIEQRFLCPSMPCFQGFLYASCITSSSKKGCSNYQTLYSIEEYYGEKEIEVMKWLYRYTTGRGISNLPRKLFATEQILGFLNWQNSCRLTGNENFA